MIYNTDGSAKDTVHCQICAIGYHPSKDGRSCVPCHESFAKVIHDPKTAKAALSSGTCYCPDKDKEYKLMEGVCFSASELRDLEFKDSFKLDYERSSIESYVLKEHLRLAYLFCKADMHNQTACQILANLCTLNLHSFGAESIKTACDLHKSMSTVTTHVPIYNPKLFYSEFEANNMLSRTHDIPHQFNMDFSSYSSDINITTVKFSFDGKYLGLSDLSDHIPCSDPPLVQGISRKFGATYKTHCSMGIQQLWEKYRKEEMIFLDPYVSIVGGYNNDHKLYEIPVKIQNFKRNGVKINMVKFDKQVVLS